MGIHVVQNPLKCTHLAAPTLVRTQKFLCALTVAPIVLSSDFIDACIEKGEVPPCEKFLLKDKTTESRYDLKLKDVIGRAKANKGSLLRLVPICCTAEVPSGTATYDAIVKANGGIMSIYRARPNSTIKKSDPEEDDVVEPVYLISGNRPEERRLWPKFEETAKAGNLEPRIVSTEWLLDVAMSQQLRWDEKYLVQNQKE